MAPTLAHSSFVGRRAELQQLQVAFEAATNGHGALIMLVGEPGIGKTALSEKLCSFVEASGGRPLVGHCYEEGSFRAPYQPFVEVFGAYLHECDTDSLTADLDAGAVDLVRMVPVLRERLNIASRPAGDPEEDRWRLLQSATDFLRNAAAKQPLLLVLEDLHDADRGTLDLLLYLARNLHGAHILVVGTYRDVEVDRAHPLSAALSELHRASNVARVHLRGLSTYEVQRLLAESSRQTIPQPLAELVHRQTEGNPLFVRETLRYVLDAGLVEQHDGALRRVGEQSLAGRIPEGLRDAVGKRLSRLSDATNRILSLASVIGREFQLDVLQQVLAGPDEEFEAALEEASTAGIIEERSVVGATIMYRFSHAFFRQTLYDEIIAPRRIRLHQQVARALEDVDPRRLEEHAAELAEHYAFSSDVLDLRKAVHYGELAAARATNVFAYSEAAHQLERALVILDLADPGDQSKRCDLLLALGEACWPAGETERVMGRVAPEALALAEMQGDRRQAFRACRLALDCLDAQGAASITRRPEYLQWAERAHRYADVGSAERIYADLALSSNMLYSTDSTDPHPQVARAVRQQQARALRLEALALARQHGDTEALFRLIISLIIAAAPQHWGECMRLAEEMTRGPRPALSGAQRFGQTLGTLLWLSGWVHFAQGERDRAEKLWREVEELAERTHVVSVKLRVPQRDAILAIVDGHLDDALLQLRRYVERADESGALVRGRSFGLQMLMSPVLYLGRAETWLRAYDEFDIATGFSDLAGISTRRAICLAQLGRLDEARAIVGPLLDEIADTSGDDEAPMSQVVLLLQAAVALEHRSAARVLIARLKCVAHLSAFVTVQSCIARHLGDASALVGNRAAARAYYLQALESAGKVHFRAELALTHLSLAELLLDDAEDAAPSRALEHLNIAIAELRDMHMQPALERALRLLEQISPQAPLSAADAPVSTGLTGREQQVARLLAVGRSNREIADTLVISEGTVEVHVKHILSKLGLRSRAQVAAWAGNERT